MDQNQEIFARYMNDPDFAKVVVDVLRKQVYEQIKTEVKQELVQPSRHGPGEPQIEGERCGRNRIG